MDYKSFLDQKKINLIKSGFNPSNLNEFLFPFQRFIANEALEKGRFAIFADCGLGKTIMQLEFAHQVANYKKKPALIACPLAVAGQTIKEAKKFGYASIDKVGHDTEIQITNYEQLHLINADDYSAIILDESSILKNYEGAYRNLIIDKFRKTEFKLACTATPAPNDPMELGNHAEFLGVMSRIEVLAMYFVHDGGETSKWRLKGHAKSKFYNFIRSFSVMLTKPSDLGFDDSGYNLPELNFHEIQIKTKSTGGLFNEMAISATDFNRELRRTMSERMTTTANIVNNTIGSQIIWIKQDEEGRQLIKLIPGAIEVKGSDSQDYKEKMLLGFAEGEFDKLITKQSIASYGLNYQNCHEQVFPSLDFSFEKLYQAIRRSYRFGQKYPVNIRLLTTDTMMNVILSIKRKQKQFEEMQYEMSKSICV